MEKAAQDNLSVSNELGADSRRNSRDKLNRTAKTMRNAAFSAALLFPLAADAQPPEIVPIEQISDTEELLTRSIHEGNGIVSLAEAILGPEISRNDREQVRNLALDIMELNGLPRDLDSEEARNIPAGTQIIIPIKVTSIYTIESGDNPSDLWRSLGYKKAGYSKDEFAQANGIPNINKITTGDRLNYAPGHAPTDTTAANTPPVNPEEPRPLANTPPVLPPSQKTDDELIAAPIKPEPELELPPEAPDLVTSAAEIKELSITAGQLAIDQPEVKNFNESVLDEMEAEEALDLLIKATDKYENPLAGYRVNIEELQPTPVADSLRDKRSGYIEDLASGRTNLAYIQSHVINELAAKSEASNEEETKSLVAGKLLDAAADKYDWIIGELERDYWTDLMLKGTNLYEYSSDNRAFNEAQSLNWLDEDSLTLYLFNEVIEQHIADQTEVAALANEHLESLAPSLADLGESELENIAKNMVFARQQEQAANDYLHDVLVAKLGDLSIEEGLALVRQGVLSSQLSVDLPELFPSLKAELDAQTLQFITLDGAKELGSLISGYEQLLNAKMTEISEYGSTLELEQSLINKLNPSLPELDEDVLYEVSKIILSQKENGPQSVDVWYQLVEAKVFVADPSAETVEHQTATVHAIRGLVEGIYITAGAGFLLEDSQAEQTAIDASVEGFIAGDTKNLAEYVEGTAESLNTRITESEIKVGTIIEAVSSAVPDLNIQESELLSLAVEYLSTQDSNRLAGKIISDYVEISGQVLAEAQTAMIDLELIKINQADETKQAEEIRAYLNEFYISRDVLTGLGSVMQQGNTMVATPTDYEPVLASLAKMVSKDMYSVQYADGDSLNIFSAQFMDRISRFDGTPESIFEGNSFRIAGYAGQDLRPFFEYLKISGKAVMDDRFNSGLSLDGEAIISDGKTPIWFNSSSFPNLEQENLEAAADWVYGEIPGFKYPVKQGDTLAEIAQMFRHSNSGKAPTIDELLAHNRGRIKHEDLILVGQEIVIPAGYNVYIDSLENADVIEINIDNGSKEDEEPSTSPSPSTPETIPENAKIIEADLGSLGTIKIVQMTDTFQTDRKMNPTAGVYHWAGSFYSDSNAVQEFINGIKSNKACGEAGCSTQIFVSEQGVIYQLSDLDSHLAHAKGANGVSIGIEMEGYWGNDGMPNDEQYNAALQIGAYLVEKKGISLEHDFDNLKGIFGHYHIDGSHHDPEDSGKTDPGERFMKQLRNDLDKWANPPSVTTGSPETTTAGLNLLVDSIDNKLGDVEPEVLQDFAKKSLSIAESKGINMTPQGLAAYMAHVYSESRFKPHAVGDNGKSFGIFQAQGGRNDGLPDDLEGQIAFSFDDMVKDGNAMGYDMISAMQDPKMSLDEIVEMGYEWLRPQKHLDKDDAAKQYRFDHAAELLADFMD